VVSTGLVRLVARALLVPVLLFALALLVKGYADVGDGFAAGVVAALAVLLQYLAFGRAEVERRLPVRRAPQVAIGGLVLSLLVAFVPVLAGGAPLQHWPAPGASVVHFGALEIISAVLFDVGVFLLVLGVCVGIIHLLTGARR
jgi:multisubunit Na+/H+ antiporter MnhB subunit